MAHMRLGITAHRGDLSFSETDTNNGNARRLLGNDNDTPIRSVADIVGRNLGAFATLAAPRRVSRLESLPSGLAAARLRLVSP